MGKTYAYARVSTLQQNEDRQIDALTEYGVDQKHIFIDKQSGKDFNRPKYQKMVKTIRKDDILVIMSIDRLGRNYSEILEQWRYLTKEKGVDIVVLDMPLLDTRTCKDLLGTFISDMILQLLSFVAENERKNIKERQRQGIKSAKARGVRFGRPELPLPDNFDEVKNRWYNKEISIRAAALLCGMPKSTFYVKAKR